MRNQTENPEGLERLQKELYAKEEGQELTLRRKELSLPGKRLVSGGPPAEKKIPEFQNVMLARAKRRRRWLMVGAGALALIVLFVGAVVVTMRYRASQQVRPEQIGIEVRGPTDVTAGSSVEYVVAYHNDSHEDWQSVEITLDTPAGMQVTASTPPAEGREREFTWRLGNVAEGAGGEVTVTGKLIGEEGAVAAVQAEITLTPANFPSGRFSKTALSTTRIAALPIDVSIDAASSAGAGERVRGVIHVRNVGGEPLVGAVLRLTIPPGVDVLLEDPEFSPGFEAGTGQWALENLASLSETTRTIIFSVAGQPGERRPIEITVGVREGEVIYTQRRVTHVVNVAASELAVTQTYNKSAEPQAVFPESAMHGAVAYRNVGTVGMRNVVVTLRFEGTGFDAKTLQLKTGAYDPRTNAITWSSVSVPELKTLQPGQSGELPFDFNILPVESFPTSGENAKNFIFISTATIDSQDLPTPVGQPKKVISDRAILSVGTTLTPEIVAFYDDGRLGIKSEGPLPPHVGETTTYTVRLRIGSTLNDVGDIRVTAQLPEGVAYTGKTVVSSGMAEFNDRSGEVVWSIPLLPALTGRTQPAEELYFQVAVTPGANVQGKVLALVQNLVAAGQDTFIDETVTAEEKDLPTAETASPGQGTVE